MILQNAINNWHTLLDNISDPSAETLLQTGVSCSYVLNVIIAKLVSFQRQFYYVQVTFGYRVFRYSDELSRGCQVRCQDICYTSLYNSATPFDFQLLL